MVQAVGEREVQRKVDHYSPQDIFAVGFKIENERAVQFRKWVMDAERLKSGGSVVIGQWGIGWARMTQVTSDLSVI